MCYAKRRLAYEPNPGVAGLGHLEPLLRPAALRLGRDQLAPEMEKRLNEKNFTLLFGEQKSCEIYCKEPIENNLYFALAMPDPVCVVPA